ncbi:FtsK/SpoIIIE domain-containing protein [Streptomyces sp. NPDC001205]
MGEPSTTASVPERSPVIAWVMYGVGLAMISLAASQLLNIPEIIPYGLGAAVVLAVLGAGLAGIAQRRSRSVRSLTEALAPVLRPETTRGMVTARRRRDGIPTRIKIKYPATFDDRDEKKRAEVRQIVATRLGAPVEATWQRRHSQVLCVVDVSSAFDDIVESDTPVEVTATGDTPEQARLRARTTNVVHSIMGTAADVADVVFDGDAPVRVEVRYPTTSRDLSVHYRHRVTLQMDSKLPGTWRDKWDFENDTVTFELRPPFPTNVRYPLLHKARDYSLPYAVTEEHSIVSWKLGSKNPHCLVVGPTGSGKTVFIRNLVVAAVMLGIPVVLCDPKMTEYLDFEGLPGVTVLTDPEDIALAISRVHGEMMDRYDSIKRREARKGDFSKILFVLDEFYIFKEAIAEVWAAMKAENKERYKGREHPCMSQWRRLTVLARTAMIHLVLGIQRPDAEFLSGLARDSFRMRVSLDRTTRESAQMMWGDSRIGSDLPNIQGRAVATTDEGPEYVQVIRLLTPEDDGAFTADDAQVWDTLVGRMTRQAEAHANGDDPLAFLGHLARVAAYRSRPAVDTPPPPIEVAAEAESVAAAAVEAELGDAEECGVYELEVGDSIQLQPDDEFVEVLDLHFGEDEDSGEEWIEINYATEDGGSDVQQLPVEQLVTRRIAATV